MNKALSISSLVFGVLTAALSLLLGILRAADGTLTVLAGIVLALALCGGVVLILFGLCDRSEFLRSRLLSPSKGAPAQQFLAIAILVACTFLFLLAYDKAQTTESVPQSTVQSGILYETARVLSIDDDEYQGQQDFEDIPVGKQIVSVELTSGQFKGRQYQLQNDLSYLYGTLLHEGDPITVAISLDTGEIDNIIIQDYDRTIPLLLVIAAFIVATVLVGGKIGAKSLIGLALTIVCIFTILIPLLLQGYPTIPSILAMCAFVTVVEFILLGGLNKKTVCAILGTISGVVIAALFGEIACELMRINGYKMYVVEPTVEALLQLKQTQDPMKSLQIGDLLVGGILIATLGAVNDVAMSISSAMNELVTVNPNLTRRQLLRSGMNIGRDMVGTMTNTLILAFVGGSLVVLIYLTSLEPSFTQLMTTGYVSVEVVQGIASSIGVILAVPVSVIIGMLFFGVHHKSPTRKASKKK